MIECPFCGMENAFHDGRGYVCPDCGAKQGGNEESSDTSPYLRVLDENLLSSYEISFNNPIVLFNRTHRIVRAY